MPNSVYFLQSFLSQLLIHEYTVMQMCDYVAQVYMHMKVVSQLHLIQVW